jgi:hypothetical protein
MARPQPGQKAAVPGICAAQSGHDVSGTFFASPVSSLVSSIVATISKREVGSKSSIAD